MTESFLNASHDAAYAKAAVRFAEALVRGETLRGTFPTCWAAVSAKVSLLSRLQTGRR